MLNIFVLLACIISVLSMYLQADKKTVYILFRWFNQKASYLDLQCFKSGLFEIRRAII